MEATLVPRGILVNERIKTLANRVETIAKQRLVGVKLGWICPGPGGDVFTELFQAFEHGHGSSSDKP